MKRGYGAEMRRYSRHENAPLSRPGGAVAGCFIDNGNPEDCPTTLLMCFPSPLRRGLGSDTQAVASRRSTIWVFIPF